MDGDYISDDTGDVLALAPPEEIISYKIPAAIDDRGIIKTYGMTAYGTNLYILYCDRYRQLVLGKWPLQEQFWLELEWIISDEPGDHIVLTFEGHTAVVT